MSVLAPPKAGRERWGERTDGRGQEDGISLSLR